MTDQKSIESLITLSKEQQETLGKIGELVLQVEQLREVENQLKMQVEKHNRISMTITSYVMKAMEPQKYEKNTLPQLVQVAPENVIKVPVNKVDPTIPTKKGQMTPSQIRQADILAFLGKRPKATTMDIYNGVKGDTKALRMDLETLKRQRVVKTENGIGKTIFWILPNSGHSNGVVHAN